MNEKKFSFKHLSYVSHGKPIMGTIYVTVSKNPLQYVTFISLVEFETNNKSNEFSLNYFRFRRIMI